MAQEPSLMPSGETGGHAAVTSVALVIILLVVGGLFLVSSNRQGIPADQAAAVAAATSTSTETLSTSTKLTDIDKDLQSLDAGTSDADLNQLEKDIQSL